MGYDAWFTDQDGGDDDAGDVCELTYEQWLAEIDDEGMLAWLRLLGYRPSMGWGGVMILRPEFMPSSRVLLEEIDLRVPYLMELLVQGGQDERGE